MVTEHTVSSVVFVHMFIRADMHISCYDRDSSSLFCRGRVPCHSIDPVFAVQSRQVINQTLGHHQIIIIINKSPGGTSAHQEQRDPALGGTSANPSEVNSAHSGTRRHVGHPSAQRFCSLGARRQPKHRDDDEDRVRLK